MRIVVDALVLSLGLLIQNTLLGHFSLRGVGVDLLAVLLGTISIVQGWLYGALGGLVCGLVMDSIFGLTGFYSLQYMAFGMMVGLANEKIRFDNWFLPMLAVFCAYCIKELVPMAYLFFTSATIKWGFAFAKVLLSGLLCAVWLLPIHALFRRLHKWDVISAPIFHFHGKKW